MRLTRSNETIRNISVGAGADGDSNSVNRVEFEPYYDSRAKYGLSMKVMFDDAPRTGRWFNEDEMLDWAAAIIVMVQQQRDKRRET